MSLSTFGQFYSPYDDDKRKIEKHISITDFLASDYLIIVIILTVINKFTTIYQNQCLI